MDHTPTRCKTLQHTATDCNTPQHTTTHCNTLQPDAIQQHIDYHSCMLRPLSWDRSNLPGKARTSRGCATPLKCVAVCCSLLQCVAVCCSVLQCVAVCCSVLQWVAVTNFSRLRDSPETELLQSVAVF